MKIKKKIKFLSSKRALLENEIVLKKFYNYAVKKYSSDELIQYSEFLEKVCDTDLLDVIISKKTPEDFVNKYNIKFLQDIKKFINEQQRS